MAAPSFEQLVPRWLVQASLGAAILTVPSVILDVVEGLPHTVAVLAHILNWAVWSVFLLTLVVALVRAEHPWQALRANPILPVVVVLTTPIAPAGLQMFRLLRLGALLGAAHHAQRVFSLQGLRYAAIGLGIVVIGGGAVFSAVEHTSQHLSFQEGVWFAIETVTTVGYGDIVPHTEAGRAVAVVVMISGIGTAALVVGAASQRFVNGDEDPAADTAAVADPTMADLQREILALRADVAALRRQIGRSSGAPDP
jgi:voltage-gated potassium channel